jgi:hypothetical protein
MEILFWQDHIVGKNPGMVEDSQHRAVRAVGGAAGETEIAGAARTVDLSDHDLPGEFSSGGYYLSHKFVAGNALKTHVSPENFKVCVANSRNHYPDEYFVVCRNGDGNLLDLQ